MVSTIFTLLSALLFIAPSLAAPHKSTRQTKPLPYLNLTTEHGHGCFTHPDQFATYWYGYGWREGATVNATCWIKPDYMEPSAHGFGKNGTNLWLWISEEKPQFSRPDPRDYGNGHLGGITTGSGCWAHEEQVKGGDISFEDVLQNCGPAPRHQVAFGFDGPNPKVTCYECTDLENEACRATKKEFYQGYQPIAEIGCWKTGTEINGNSTWVNLFDGNINCWVGPDQFDPKKWHGLPAGKCKE